MNKQLVDKDMLDASLLEIANQIRRIKNTTEKLSFPVDFISSINSINSPSQDELDEYLAAIVNKEVTVIDNKEISQIYTDFQYGNDKLTHVSLPGITNIPQGSFSKCSNLKVLNIPNVTSISGGAIVYAQMDELYLPSLKSMTSWGWTYQGCTFSKAYFPRLEAQIGSNDFSGCNNLTALILGHPTIVCPMTSTNPFGGSTPLAKGTGYIYVPRALLNDYKTAENWSTYAAQIRAIEDYPELINRVPYATETNVFNIYNNGLGYKEGYRLSSKNVEKPQNNSVITGYIYAKPDNVIQMHNATWGTTESDGYCYISFYNSDYQQVATANRYKMADPDTGISNVSNVNIEKSTISTVNGVTTFNVIPTVDYSYIRISATGNGADMIVTVT